MPNPSILGEKQVHESDMIHARLPPNRALSYLEAYTANWHAAAFIYFLRTPIIWRPRPRVNRALASVMDVTRSVVS